MNPEWNAGGGNLINDFGIGPWRASAEAFVARFKHAYSYRELRIRGQTLRVLFAYPGPWQVFALDGAGGVERIATADAEPSFADLEAMVAALGGRSIANADWATRLRSELLFSVNSAKPPPPQK